MRRQRVVTASALTAVIVAGSIEPATAGRAAVEVDIRLSVASDGATPFTGSEGPGLDAGAANGIVRTNDTITYRVNVNVTGGTAQNETFTLRAPAGTEWIALPSRCAVPPSKIDGITLSCDLGDLTNTSSQVEVGLRVTGALTNGEVVETTASVTAGNAAVKDVAAPRPARTTVSSQPAFDLVKDRFHANLVSAPGPNGEPGQLVSWPVVVESTAAEPGVPRKLGAERLTSPLTFTDDLSRLLNGQPAPGARLYTWGDKRPGSGCGPNEYGGFGAFNAPGGTGGRDESVTDSGTMTCVQAGPGQNLGVTISGADTSATHTPIKALYDSLPADNGYVISDVIMIWIPLADLEAAAQRTGRDSVTIRNTLTGFAPAGASGQPNFGPGGQEPTANNSRELSLKVTAGTDGGDKFYILPNGSGRGGQRHVTPGEQIPSLVKLVSTGAITLDPLVMCDMFDNTVQHLDDPGGQWATIDNPAARIEYAAAPGSLTPAALSKLSCDDAEGPWYTDPALVPGGPKAVNRVRTVGPLPGNGSQGLRVNLRVREDITPGTRLRNFGSWKAPQLDGGAWHYTKGDPADAEGVLADHLLATPVLARIVKKTVDAGTTAATTPDRQRQVTGGTTLTFGLYPSLTKSGGDTGPQDVTIVDTLPAGLNYAGDASLEPGSVTENADGTTTVTWTLKDRRPGEVIVPITFGALADPEAPPGQRLNKAVISTPLDASPEPERTAQRSVELLRSQSILITKDAVRPVVIVGDTVDYDLTVTNQTGSPLSRLEIIDVLPWAADRRTPASAFAGRAGLAAAPDTAPGDRLSYSANSPATISLNPNAASNDTGGATRWCTPAELGRPGCPQGLAGATAFRIVRPGPIAVGAKMAFALKLTNKDQAARDTYTNRAGAASPDLPLPVQSLDRPVRVVAGCLGDHVWLDGNRNGLQDHGEPALPGAKITLTGTDDKGASVRRTTTSGKDGRYLFERLRPGTYSLTFTPPTGGPYTFTATHKGPDPARDSNPDHRGRTGPITLAATGTGADLAVGCDRTVDAGLNRRPPGPPPPPPPRPTRKLKIVKTADRHTVRTGDRVRYTIKVTNTGTAPYPATDPATFTDDLSGLRAAARHLYRVSASTGTILRTGRRLTWSGPLRPGQTATITYHVQVTSAKPRRAPNTVSTTGPSNCPPGSADPRCTVTVLIVPRRVK